MLSGKDATIAATPLSTIDGDLCSDLKGLQVPKGPHGEKRPADAVARAIMVAKIATGEVEDEREELTSAAAHLGSKGGKARAANLSPERRARIARKAAEKRWEGR